VFKTATLVYRSLSSNTRVIWPTTVIVADTRVRQLGSATLEHSLSVGRATVLETGPLPPQDHKSGTVCRPISDYVGCHTASPGGYWRHFYSDSEATAQCELFTAPNRNILTYLPVHRIIWSWYTGRWWMVHLVQRGGDWAWPQPVQDTPRCIKCNSPPINGQCTYHRTAV